MTIARKAVHIMTLRGLILLLLVAAIANIAVAALLAAQMRPPFPRTWPRAGFQWYTSPEEQAALQDRLIGGGLKSEPYFASHWQHGGLELTMYVARGSECAWTIRTGWPLRALQCTGWTAASAYASPGVLVRTESADGVVIAHAAKPVVIPLRPALPGFIVNTLLYALVLWGLVPLRRGLVRHVRRRRGLCAWCRYPRGSSMVCTECGRTDRA